MTIGGYVSNVVSLPRAPLVIVEALSSSIECSARLHQELGRAGKLQLYGTYHVTGFGSLVHGFTINPSGLMESFIFMSTITCGLIFRTIKPQETLQYTGELAERVWSYLMKELMALCGLKIPSSKEIERPALALP